MTKVDIFSGFLGAGKTTLIKKLIKEAYSGEKLVLIENEFGEIGIDGGFMKEAGIEITEMNSGCICCSLVGDFGEALQKVLDEYSPDRILIEPSGVGKLSDVIRAVMNIHSENLSLNSFTAVVDAKKCKMYMKNFGEFFNDQIEHAGCIVLSHTDNLDSAKIDECVKMIKQHNEDAVIVTTPWDKLDGVQLLGGLERRSTLESAIKKLESEQHHEHHHDHDHEHEHHHDHEHEHEHGHHHHHADEIFESWGTETAKSFTKDKLESILSELENEEKYGIILRAKGIVDSGEGSWIHFDYIPGEADIRNGAADITGRLCVIGSKINTENIKKLFEI